MGQPGTNWAYLAQPKQPLYPRGRLLVATEDTIIYDGPNTYWHGMFPFCRLKLWSVPWQFLGIPLFNDLLPLQDAINDTVQDIRLAMRQWTNPDITYNRTAVSEATMKLMDPRRPGKRVKVMPGFGDPWKKEDGPNPSIIQLGIEMWEKLTQKFADLSGTANLSALLQLRQMPVADTIQKYYEALTPEIRNEARQVELFLRDFSEMVKINYFQFLSAQKRIQILGAGRADAQRVRLRPGSIRPLAPPRRSPATPRSWTPTHLPRPARAVVPQAVHLHRRAQLGPGDGRHRAQDDARAAGAHGLLRLLVAARNPGNAQRRRAARDPAAAALARPRPTSCRRCSRRCRTRPARSRRWPPARCRCRSTPTRPPAAPSRSIRSGGTILELRVPVTVTERLQAQSMLGIGQTENPAGRKATGQAPPQQETKNDQPGGRSTITESQK